MKSPLARRILVNAASNWVTFGANLVVTLYLSPILVQGLGERRYGVWALVESILSYLSLLDMGIAASVLRYVARYDAQRDQEGINKVFNTSLAIFSGAGLVALALAGGIASFGLRQWSVPAEYATEARLLLTLLGANFALNLPLGVFPSILEGLNRYPAKNAVRSALVVARVPFILAVVQRPAPLIGLAIVILAFNVVENLVHAVLAWVFLPGLRLSLRCVSWSTFRTIRGYSADALVAMLSHRVAFQTDALVIGAFIPGAQFIAYFAIAAKLVEYSKTGPGMFVAVLTPSISSMEARGDWPGIRRVLMKGTRYVLYMILPIQVGLLLLGKSFLALWQTPSFAASSYPVLVILAATMALAVSQNVSIRILYGIGQIRLFSWSTALQAAVNLVLSVALVRGWGIEGVAFGTALPNLVYAIFIAVHSCRILDVRPSDYVAQSFVKPLLAALVLTAVWGVAIVNYPPVTWLQWVTIGCVGMIVYIPLAALLELGRDAVVDKFDSMFKPRPDAVGSGLGNSTIK